MWRTRQTLTAYLQFLSIHIVVVVAVIVVVVVVVDVVPYRSSGDRVPLPGYTHREHPLPAATGRDTATTGDDDDDHDHDDARSV